MAFQVWTVGFLYLATNGLKSPYFFYNDAVANFEAPEYLHALQQPTSIKTNKSHIGKKRSSDMSVWRAL